MNAFPVRKCERFSGSSGLPEPVQRHYAQARTAAAACHPAAAAAADAAAAAIKTPRASSAFDFFLLIIGGASLPHLSSSLSEARPWSSLATI